MSYAYPVSICRACGQDTAVAASCSTGKWHHGAARVPFGSETGSLAQPGDRCHDCLVPYGGFHHIWCDFERCPICDGQALYCEHSAASDSVLERAGTPAYPGEYWLSEVIHLTEAKRSQVENWVRSGWVAPAVPSEGTGHHRRFNFNNLVEITIAVRLSQFRVPIATLLRDAGVKKIAGLLPDYSELLSRTDEDWSKEYAKGLEDDGETLEAIVAEWNQEHPDQPFTTAEYLLDRARATRKHYETIHSAWTAFRNPKTRAADAFLALAIFASGRNHILDFYTKPPEQLWNGAALMVDIGSIVRQLERETGDFWRDANQEY